MYAKLDGKTALINGAGTGMGAAAAKILARNGAKVAITARHKEGIEKVAREISDAGGEALAIVCDVSSEEDVRNAIKRIADGWGRLDILFHNAGINGKWAPIDKLGVEDFENVIRINLVGTYIACKHAAPLIKKNGGSIIITASINGTRTFSNEGATGYSASNAGQVAMMKQLAVEFARDRIRVNAICPGTIATDINERTDNSEQTRDPMRPHQPGQQIPLTRGRPGMPEQVGELVLFLASDASNHISGTEVFIDGAQSMLI